VQEDNLTIWDLGFGIWNNYIMPWSRDITMLL
jgi:hypothetical protein